jgi:hypothetical protein
MVYPKAVPLQPFHIGEELIARMLTDIASRDLLGDVHCELTGRTLLLDFADCGLLDGFELHTDSASLRIDTTEGDFECDGAQTVDILCTGERRALAIEAKLGDARLGPNDFRQRFCVPCEVSRHKDRRLRGNMIAVLERSFADECPTSTGITCTANGSSWPLSVAWWLFLRRPVILQWKRFTWEGVLSNAARIGEFDRLVEIYGRDRFDALVRDVVGQDFAQRWRL